MSDMIPFFTINSKTNYYGIEKTNQMIFFKILFHLIEVHAYTGFTCEKRLLFTSYAQCNSVLWKTCEISFNTTDKPVFSYDFLEITAA